MAACFCGLLLLLGSAASLSGASVTLSPTSDAYVNDSDLTGTFNNAWLVAGRSPAEFTPRYRSFLRFDLSGIPSNAIVSSALLRLNLQAYEGASAATIGVRRVLASWSTGTLTWNVQPAFSSAASASTAVGATIGVDYQWTITGLVQDWVEGQFSNYGLALVVANETTATVTRTFASANHTTAASRPELVVIYALPADIAFTPTLLGFGNQRVGTTSLLQNVTVLNNGGSTLWISNVTSSSSQFLIGGTPPFPASLGPGSSGAFQVRFAPTSAGAKSGMVNIISSDSDEPNIALPCTGTGVTPDINVAPTSLAFGNQLIGTTSLPQTVTIQNTGSARLLVTSIGSSSAQFPISVGTSLPATIVPGGNLMFQVRFNPSGTAGARTATVTIASDDPDEPTRTVACTGTGVTPDIDVAPTSLTFGNQLIGTTSLPQTVTIQNTGSADLRVGSLSSSSSQFVLTLGAGLPATIAPGGNLQFEVRFAPTSIGAKSGTIAIASDDPNEAIRTVSCTGTRVTPDIDVAPSSLAFGNQLAGGTSSPQTVTIQNTGSANLLVTSIGSSSAQFPISVGTGLPAAIAPGGNLIFSIRFSPTGTGARAATVTIASDDTDEPTRSVACTGTGVAPEIDVAPSSVAFGNQLLGGTSSPQTVTVQNTGSANLLVTSIGSSSAQFPISVGTGLPATVAPGGNLMFQVRFSPNGIGARAATVTIASDDTDEPTRSVACTGTGVVPDIEVMPVALNFGNQLLGTTSAPQTVTIQNTGSADLRLTSILVTNSDFTVSLTTGLPATIAPGASLPVEVRFAPANPGFKQSCITFLSDDPDEPVREVNCMGTSTAPRIRVTPPSIDFSNVVVGTTARRDMNFKNDGNVSLVISSVMGTNPVFRLEGPPLPLTLAPAQEVTVPVAYTPLAVRQDLDRFRIRSNDPLSPDIFIEMGGAGEPPPCDAAGPLPLHITVNAGQRNIWNVERAGLRFWNFEGDDYEVAASDKYPDPYEVQLDQAICTEHFVVYYPSTGDDAMTLEDANDLAGAMEEGWEALVQDQGFRTPTDLQTEGHYWMFQDFERIPVLLAYPAGGLNGAANPAPFVQLRPTLTSASRTPIHEFFHIILSGYTRHRPGWLNEGLARWSEQFKPGETFPCGAEFMSLSHDFLTRKYCDTAPWFQYLGLKYSAENPADGSDVIRAIAEEMNTVDDRYGTMLAFERALSRFDGGRASGHGNAFAEWTAGNYVNDSVEPPTLRTGAPLIPRYKEGGWIAPGGNRYLFRQYSFVLPQDDTVTIQIRASAGNLDGDADADDLRVLLDGEVLGDLNTDNAFDGDTLQGRIQTLHLVRANLAAGTHTIRLEADEQPTLYSMTVFQGNVPLLLPSSPEVTLNGEPYPTYTFEVADGAREVTVLMTGVARTNDAEYARLYLDGGAVTGDNQRLYGPDLEGDLATVEVRFTNLSPGARALEVRGDGQPVIRDLVAFTTPAQPPLLQVRTCKLLPWSAGYQVVPVHPAFFDLDHQDILIGNDVLQIRFTTIEWDDGLTPPFTEVIRVAADGTSSLPSFRTQEFEVQRGYSADMLEALGEDGRLVHVTTATSFGGTYELVVTRVTLAPDRYDRPPLGDPPNNLFADATSLPNAPGGDEWEMSGDAFQRTWTMRVRNLNLHTPDDVDYFCLNLPAEALRDCNTLSLDCPSQNLLKLGHGRLTIRVVGASAVFKLDALGQEVARDEHLLEWNCQETETRACFAIAASGEVSEGYEVHVTYTAPDAGFAQRLDELCQAERIPGFPHPADDDSDILIINPDQRAAQDFWFGLKCNPIVCDPPLGDFLLFDWSAGGPLEIEFEHAGMDRFQFELLDMRLQTVSGAIPDEETDEVFRSARPTLTQSLKHRNLTAGTYLIRVTGARPRADYSVRFVPLQADGPLPVTGNRPLLVVLLEFNDLTFADPSYFANFQTRIFGPAEPNVTEYYRETSHGNFTYVPATDGERYGDADGMVHVVMPVRQANAPAGREYRRQAMAMADEFFDFSLYDANGDGSIQFQELAVLVIQATGGDSGGVRRTAAVVCDDASLEDMPVAVISDNAPNYVLYHELAHLVDYGRHTPDLYNLRDGFEQKTICWTLDDAGQISRDGSVGHEIALELDANWFAAGGSVVAYRDQNGELSVANYDLSDPDRPVLKNVVRAGLATDLSVCQVSPLRIMTAVQSGGDNLKLILWNVGFDWSLTRAGDITPEPGSDIDVTAVSSSRVVAAFRNSDGNLKLTVFDISAGGELTPVGSYTGGGASEINVVHLSSTRVITAVRLPDSGHLKLICFDIAQDGTLTRRGDYSAGSSRDIDLAVVGARRVAASVRTASDRCKVILFEVNNAGDFDRLGSHEEGSLAPRQPTEIQPNTSVTAVGTQIVFSYVDSDLLMQIRALTVEDDDSLTVTGSAASAGKIRSAKLVRLPYGDGQFATVSRSDGAIWTGRGFSILGANTGNRVMHFDPYTKLKLGWLPYREVTCRGGNFGLHPMGATGNEALIVRDPSHRESEYFILEVRKRDSRYEQALSDEGLAIWHVDETLEYWPNAEPFVSLEWLGGGLGSALWDATDTSLTLYDDSTAPAGSRWNDFSTSGIAISGVADFFDGLSFDLRLRPCLAFRRITRTSGGAMTLEFSGDPGRSYRIETSSDLNRWTSLGDVTTANDGTAEFLDTSAASVPTRFYRVTRPE